MIHLKTDCNPMVLSNVILALCIYYRGFKGIFGAVMFATHAESSYPSYAYI